MYKLAKFLVRPRGECGNTFLVVPVQRKSTDFEGLLLQRIHESGLASGECYASEKQILYLSDHQTAEYIAKMFRTTGATPRSRRTRNERLGLEIMRAIRESSPEFNALVGSYLVSFIQRELFVREKRRQAVAV